MTDRKEDRIDLALTVRKLWRGRREILFCTTISVLIAISYLHLATYYYTASLTLVPTQAQSQSNLNQLGGLASLAGINLSSQQNVTPFTLYTDALTSVAVADDLSNHAPDVMRRLFHSQWDENLHRWVEPSGAFHFLTTILKSVIGYHITPWTPPGSPQLKDIIAKRVLAQQDLKKPVLTVSFQHPDPAFAKYFLERLNESTDRVLRRMALDRANQYAGYLQSQLASVQQTDLRTVLMNSLSQQETLIMMGNASTSFAAQSFGPANRSLQPTFPDPIIVILVSVIIGLLVGSLLVYYNIISADAMARFFIRQKQI